MKFMDDGYRENRVILKISRKILENSGMSKELKILKRH